MSYFSIQELPSQVTASLDNEDAKKWMEAYNEQNPQSDEEVKEAKKKAWKACAKLPSSFSFKITASVEVPDKQGEVVDMKTLREHMDPFIEFGGNVNYNHRNYNVAHIWDWEPAQVKGHPAIKVYGNIFGGAPVYNEVRRRFMNGDNFLSVAGENGPKERVCTEEGCYLKFPVTQLMEISLTGNPVNKYCELEWSHEGETFTKSMDDVVLSVNDVEIHRTYDECPILHLRKQLTDCGIEAHARENGVLIPAGFAKSMGDMRQYGLYQEPAEDGVLIRERDSVLESTFKKGLETDQIYPDGSFKSYGEFFEKALDDRLVEYEDGEFKLSSPELKEE